MSEQRHDISAADLADVTAEELALAVQVVRLLRQMRGQSAPAAAPAAVPPQRRQLVRLDQLAAMVHRSKFTLNKYKTHSRNTMPDPDVEGGGGRPALWDWPRIRPWLQETFRIDLPERFPGL